MKVYRHPVNSDIEHFSKSLKNGADYPIRTDGLMITNRLPSLFSFTNVCKLFRRAPFVYNSLPMGCKPYERKRA